MSSIKARIIRGSLFAVAFAMVAAVSLPARADIESFAIVHDDGSLGERNDVTCVSLEH